MTEKFKLTKEMVIEEYGLSRKQTGYYMRYGCPQCHAIGMDKDNDHLTYDTKIGILCCHAEKEHSRIEFNKFLQKYGLKTNNKPKIQIEVDEEELKFTQNVLHTGNEKFIGILKENAGYTEETVKETGIGLSLSEDNQIFIIPMYNIENQLIGYEYREAETEKGTYKFSHKSSGYTDDPKNTLCLVHKGQNPKDILVMAGFKDAHIIYQYLKENNLQEDFTVVTCSNGEPNTLKALQQNKSFLKNFERVVLCLDKDAAGKTAREKIALGLGGKVYELKLPIVENEQEKKFKDFTDWYKLSKENGFSKCILPDNIHLLPLSILNGMVKGNEELDKSIFRNVNDESISYFEGGTYPIKGSYYLVMPKTADNDKIQLILIRKSNFILKIKKKVINSNIKFGTEKEYKLEISTIIGNKETKPFIITLDNLFELGKLHDALKRNGVHISTFKSAEFKSILEKELREATSTLRVFENAGPATIDSFDTWLYRNGIINVQSKQVLYDYKDGCIRFNNSTDILLDAPRGMKTPVLCETKDDLQNILEKYPYLKDTQEEYKDYFTNDNVTLNSLLAATVIKNTIEAYNCTIDPFLLIGNAILSPFVPEIVKKIKGYPISYAYGEAQSGKSNILELIANIFGYDSSFLGGGSDTSKNLLHNLEYYNCTPLLFQEVQDSLRKQFESNVKSIYDRTPRKIMQGYGNEQNVKAVNGTMHFASNEIIPKNEQTMSRLIFMDLLKSNFDYKKAIPFNKVRDELLSLILQDVIFLKNDFSVIENLLDKNISHIEAKKLKIDSRSIKNIAVAKTGFDVLFKISGLKKEIFEEKQEFKELKTNFTRYVKKYSDSVETKDAFLLFIETFNEMLKLNLVEYGRDYKITNHSELAIYLEGIAGTFKKTFKTINTNDVFIPGMKEIKDSSKKYNCSPSHSVNFQGKAKRSLVISPESTEEIRNYIFPLIEKYQKAYDQGNPIKNKTAKPNEEVEKQAIEQAKAIL